MANFIEIKETLWMDGRTYEWTDIWDPLFLGQLRRVDLMKQYWIRMNQNKINEQHRSYMRKAQHSVSLEKRVKLVLYNDRQQGFVSSSILPSFKSQSMDEMTSDSLGLG